MDLMLTGIKQEYVVGLMCTQKWSRFAFRGSRSLELRCFDGVVSNGPGVFDGHTIVHSPRRRGRPVVIFIHNNQLRTIYRANDGDVAIVQQEKLIDMKE
ncbi:uncharacterized protein EAF01_006044 [Botrytis porri]|uniref:uncharacterized protein n=1 Tax=Botrytis porri TaxID=87229 RepID=UPI001900D0F9|nr:uncharacterized protein EAF01_006044 [Botrytis porri]KAF7905523.1 hypothetical protein EAF01_006044 [Botrytis porri]